MRRGTSGQRRKVAEAKRVVQLALGDAVRGDHPQVTKSVPSAQAEPVQPKDESVRVLSLGEVAARLGISRDEVERMVEAGKMRAADGGVDSSRTDERGGAAAPPEPSLGRHNGSAP